MPGAGAPWSRRLNRRQSQLSKFRQQLLSAPMFTRAPADYPTDRRRPLTIILVIGAVLYLALTALGTLWTDYLWFDSIGYSKVWQRKWGMSIFLGVIGIAVSFLLLWVNLRIADRLSPRWAPFDLSEEEELIERFREWIEPRARQVRLWVTGILALLLGLAVASWREDVFLFLNSQDFGGGCSHLLPGHRVLRVPIAVVGRYRRLGVQRAGPDHHRGGRLPLLQRRHPLQRAAVHCRPGPQDPYLGAAGSDRLGACCGLPVRHVRTAALGPEQLLRSRASPISRPGFPRTDC